MGRAPCGLDVRFDGDIFFDASDHGWSLHRHDSLTSSPLLPGRQVASNSWHPLPDELLSSSSTLSEIYGVLLLIRAVGIPLGSGRHRLNMYNLGCVFILVEVVQARSCAARAS
jgi:hypothetical protein